MIQYKRILVPVDGSDLSKAAIEHTCSLAKAHNSTLFLLHVASIASSISPLEQSPISPGGYASLELAQDLEDRGREVIENAKALVPEGILVETIFEVGAPGPTIIEVANTNHMDLIVMGSRGLGLLKGIFMGSVSTYVVSHESCPVLIV